MKQFEINAQKREAFTKAAVKQLRREGLVPCVLYGEHKENVHFTVVEKDLQGLIFSPYSFIVALNLDGAQRLCILHAAQYHPVNDNILHLDFLNIDEQHPVTINIPISITGHSVGVRQGGKLQVMTRKIRVKGLMDKLPDELAVDITSLQIGKAITAADLHYEGLDIVSPKATIICMVKSTRAAAATTTEQAAE